MQKKITQFEYTKSGEKIFPLIRESDIILRSDEYIVIHLDGVKFTSRYLKAVDRSIKKQVFECLTTAAIELCNFFKSSRVAYVYGDEASILLQGDFVKENYHNRIQKLCSIASSILSVNFLNQLIVRGIDGLPTDFKTNCFFAAKAHNIPNDIVNDYFKWRLMGCKKLIFDKKEQFDKCEDWEKFGHLIIFDNDWKVISIDFYNDKLVKAPQSEYFKLKGGNL